MSYRVMRDYRLAGSRPRTDDVDLFLDCAKAKAKNQSRAQEPIILYTRSSFDKLIIITLASQLGLSD